MTPREISQMGVVYIVVIAFIVIFKIKFNKPIEVHPIVIKCWETAKHIGQIGIDVIKQALTKPKK